MAARLYCFGIDSQTPVAAPVNGVPVRRAFLSDATWFPGGGIASADTLCQNEANANSIAGTFRALLGLNGGAPASRFDLGGAPWVRLDGTALVTSADQLAAPYLLTALNQTPSHYENGTVFAWLGAVGISTVGEASTTCSDWTSNNMSMTGRITNIAPLGSTAFVGVSTACTGGARLFCLER
jgi:hypothetical protein